jgi:protein-S-isoprenylcysteine O-methyltransferase Ste14
LGIVFILIGLVLNMVASNHLRKNQTPVDFNQPPNRLVTDGPFRFSRNPIYLSGVTVLFGIAILLGSLVSFCFPMLLFLLLNYIYIPSEEKEMQEMFGNDYVKYKHSVRRWL